MITRRQPVLARVRPVFRINGLCVQGFRTILRRLGYLWLIAVIAVGIVGTWLTHNPQSHEAAGRAVAAVAVEALSIDPEFGAAIEAAAVEGRHGNASKHPPLTVAQQWEQERREEEQRETIRAAFED